MASNPYVNKISVNGNVVLDLTGDGVIPSDVRAGVSFHDKSGAQKVGAMAEQGAQTITPSLSPQTIAGNKYLTGEQTISAITAALLAQLDSDFTAENIAKDVDLFGLIGTHEGGGGVSTLFGHNFVSGSIIPTEDITSDYRITWSSSDVPALYDRGSIDPIFIFYRDLQPSYWGQNPASHEWLWFICGSKKTMVGFSYGQTANSEGTDIINKTYAGAICRYNTNGILDIFCKSSQKLIAGHKYNWLVISYEEV